MNDLNSPKHWEKMNLGDVLIYIGNGLTNKQNQVGNGYPVTRIETISDDCINAQKVGYVSALTTDKIEKYRLRFGDILVSHINSEPQLGRAVIYEGNPEFLLHGMNLLRMQANTQVLDPFFLNYIFRFYRNQGTFIALAARAVGQSSINQSRMKSLVISFPPLPEQRAIANILQTIQDAKFTRQREIALERERKAALMDYLFSHGTKGEPLKQTEIGEIPESWEVVKLEDICYKPDYGYTESANDSPVGPKFLRITDIQNDVVNWEKVPYCVCSQETKEKYLLKTGDIVIARIGATTGKAYIIDNCPEAIFASYLIRVQTKDDLLPTFLVQYFRSNNYWKQIEQSKGGRLKGGVNIPILNNLVLPLPPLAEQHTIANIFRAIDEKIAALEQEVELIDELFHAMLKELMTGQRSAMPLIDVRLLNSQGSSHKNDKISHEK